MSFKALYNFPKPFLDFINDHYSFLPGTQSTPIHPLFIEHLLACLVWDAALAEQHMQCSLEGDVSTGSRRPWGCSGQGRPPGGGGGSWALRDRGGQRIRLGPSKTKRWAGAGCVSGSKEDSGLLAPRAPSGRSGWEGDPGWSHRQRTGGRLGPEQERVEQCHTLARRGRNW